MMLQELLNEHALDPKNPRKAFELAKEYDKLRQGAAAISLYIKAADLETKDKLLQYQCMLLASQCYNRQRDRHHTALGLAHHALILMPQRPEAYYFLARLWEEKHDWRFVRSYTATGLLYANDDLEDLDVNYPGKQGLLYLDAIATWGDSGMEDGKQKIFDLVYRNKFDEEYTQKSNEMLNKIFMPDTIVYKKEDLPRFKFPFDGIENIENNNSKHFQDMFVLSVFDGKRNGTYLEIGSGEPHIHNNSALLEEQFGWKGISIDNDPALCYNFSNNRTNTVLCENALEIDYQKLFETHCLDNRIDYLQIDCDEASLEILKKLPLNEYKFGVVTFEHDGYRLDPLQKEVARKIMLEHGYKLLVNDVAFAPGYPYEDWYVHPDLVRIKPEMETNKDVNFVWDYMIKGS